MQKPVQQGVPNELSDVFLGTLGNLDSMFEYFLGFRNVSLLLSQKLEEEMMKP